jgi:hypothetical protein
LLVLVKALLLINYSYVGGVCGLFASLETSLTLKGFLHSFGCSSFFYENYSLVNVDFRFNYLLNSTLNELENYSIFVLIGVHLRLESPIVHIKLRRNFIENENFLRIYSIGFGIDYLSFPITNLGNSLKSFKSFIEGKLLYFSELIFTCFENSNFLPGVDKEEPNKIMILLGSSLSTRLDSYSIFNCCNLFALEANKAEINFTVNFISDFLGRLSYLELGGSSKLNNKKKSNSFFYLCNTNSFVIPENSFVVYQGSFRHIDTSFNKINIILPSLTYVEESATYVNLEGRLRYSDIGVFPEIPMFSDWEITQVFYIILKNLSKNNFSKIKKFYFLYLFFSNVINYKCQFFFTIKKLHNRMSKILGYKKIFFSNKKNHILYHDILDIDIITNIYNYKLNNTIIFKLYINYYMTDYFTKNSKVMSICAAKYQLN